MTAMQKRVLISDIKIKLARGEIFEDIFSTYVNLTERPFQVLCKHKKLT